MEKELLMCDGLSIGQDVVDENGRLFRIVSHSTIVSDHKFDTSCIPNWIPAKGSHWRPLVLPGYEVHSKSDGRIVFDS
jgi:hypothetical protein